MYEVSVDETFAAAHNLRNYKGKCEDLHGHNYKVRVTLAGAELDAKRDQRRRRNGEKHGRDSVLRRARIAGDRDHRERDCKHRHHRCDEFERVFHWVPPPVSVTSVLRARVR